MMTLNVSGDDLTRLALIFTLLALLAAFARGLLAAHRRTGDVQPAKPDHLRAEIERLNARLAAARDFVTQAGGRRCDRCGHVCGGRPGVANYCPRCGSALSSAAVAEVSARDVNAIMRGLADPRLTRPRK